MGSVSVLAILLVALAPVRAKAEPAILKHMKQKEGRICGLDVIDVGADGKWKIPKDCKRLSEVAQQFLIRVHEAKHTRVCELGDVNRTKRTWAIPADCKELHLDGGDIGDGEAAMLAEALVRTTSSTLFLSDNTIGDAGAVSIAEALKKRNVTVKEVDLSGNRIGDIGAASLAEALEANSAILEMGVDRNSISDEPIRKIKTLLGFNVVKRTSAELRSNDPSFKSLDLGRGRYYIGDGGASLIAEALKANAGIITSVLLQNNHIGDIGAAAIAESLKADTNITTVHLTNNAIGDIGAASIAAALKVNTAVTSMFLTSNKIGPAGAAALAEALEVNKVITRIDLDGNSIGDAGAASIAGALALNTGLIKVELSSNGIGPAGAASIAKALEVNTNINRVGLDSLDKDEGGR